MYISKNAVLTTIYHTINGHDINPTHTASHLGDNTTTIMDDFASFQSTLQSALVDTTRSASALAAEDLSFFRTVDPAIGSSLDAQNARLLSLANRLLGSATASAAQNVRPTLRDVEDVEGNWAKVVDVVDSLLERADTALDEFTGAVRRLSPREQVGQHLPVGWGGRMEANGVWQTPTGKLPARPSKIAAALRQQDIEKPQLLFDNVPTNRDTAPFRPLLLSKPHARVPLETEPVPADEESQSQFVRHLFLHSPLGLDYHPKHTKQSPCNRHAAAHIGRSYPHPYQLEIDDYSYPPTVYTHAEPIKYHPFESTTATWVDTEEALDEMLQELKKADVIAVDLEHHDARSYIGIVCLMQISTRDRDWIVDTLKPWRRKLQSLNEVFTDPSIVKVLHGAHMDSIWLQRDLGLYLVGLFDTHHASRALGYQGGSYAFLLQKFTGVQAQKQYQTADWRIRPLPKELVDYARSDTHYLLYIYDNMRNELIERSDFSAPNHEKDKVHDVCERSKEYALQRYEHPIYDLEAGSGPAGWYKLLSRTPASLTKQQFAVFRALHQWRDETAREQDDSINYVMPNHLLFTIARALPSTRAELLSTAQPATQTIRLRADEMVATIAKAKKEGESGPEMLKLLAQIDPHHFKKAMEKAAAERAATFEGVAKYLPANQAQRAPTNGVLPKLDLPLRSASSMFWGGSSQQQRRPISSVPNVQLSVPLPPLTAEIFADAPAAATPEQPVSRSSPDPAPEADEDVDDTFILKQLGTNKKRKHAAADEDNMATQSDIVALPNASSERAQAKAERKKAKKEAKRAATVRDSANDMADEEEVFDYLNAPSVLNPPKMTREELKQKQKKVVDPYKKSMDAPKGLPRAQRERAGRSMTFKK